jgi:hypothetical protein
MMRWFPKLQVATACFSFSLPELNFLDPYFIIMCMHNNHCHRVTAHLQFIYMYIYIYIYIFEYTVSGGEEKYIRGFCILI